MLIGFILKLWFFFFLFASAWAGPNPSQRIAPEVASISLWLKVGLTHLRVSATFTVTAAQKASIFSIKVINKRGCCDAVCPRRRMCWKVSAINTGYQVAAAHCAAGSDLCYLMRGSKALLHMQPAQTSYLFEQDRWICLIWWGLIDPSGQQHSVRMSFAVTAILTPAVGNN